MLLEEPWINSENSQRDQIIELLKETKNTTIIVVSNE